MITRRLVLWDIDHTLVDGADLGPQIWGGAFVRLTGSPVTREFIADGSTDPAIFRDLVVVHELADQGWSDAQIEAAYAAAFTAVEQQWRERATAKTGAAEAIAALAADPAIVQSVLTGNVAANARAKLSALGLADGLDFEVGAYGDDAHQVRADLVPIARGRAETKFGHAFAAHDTVLVGDTPRDVRAGLDGGADVIGVATGSYSVDELAAAGAHHVLTDLGGLVPALHTLGERRRTDPAR